MASQLLSFEQMSLLISYRIGSRCNEAFDLLQKSNVSEPNSPSSKVVEGIVSQLIQGSSESEHANIVSLTRQVVEEVYQAFVKFYVKMSNVEVSQSEFFCGAFQKYNTYRIDSANEIHYVGAFLVVFKEALQVLISQLYNHLNGCSSHEGARYEYAYSSLCSNWDEMYSAVVAICETSPENYLESLIDDEFEAVQNQLKHLSYGALMQILKTGEAETSSRATVS